MYLLKCSCSVSHAWISVSILLTKSCNFLPTYSRIPGIFQPLLFQLRICFGICSNNFHIYSAIFWHKLHVFMFFSMLIQSQSTYYEWKSKGIATTNYFSNEKPLNVYWSNKMIWFDRWIADNYHFTHFDRQKPFYTFMTDKN